ncbi:hypothetical protein PS6_010929 [Mucor atramentarius]
MSDSLQDAIKACTANCIVSSENHFTAETCAKFCDKAAKCTDADCIKSVTNDIINAALSKSSTTTFNMGLALLFIMFTVYLVNFPPLMHCYEKQDQLSDGHEKRGTGLCLVKKK